MPPLASSPPRAGSAPLPPSPKCPLCSQGAPQGWRHVATGARDSQMGPGVGSAGSPAGPPGTSYRGPPGPGPSSLLSPKGGPGVGGPGLQLPSRLTAPPRPRQAGDRLTGDTRGRGPLLVSLHPPRWPHGSADPFLVPCGSGGPPGAAGPSKSPPLGMLTSLLPRAQPPASELPRSGAPTVPAPGSHGHSSSGDRPEHRGQWGWSLPQYPGWAGSGLPHRSR